MSPIDPTCFGPTGVPPPRTWGRARTPDHREDRAVGPCSVGPSLRVTGSWTGWGSRTCRRPEVCPTSVVDVFRCTGDLPRTPPKGPPLSPLATAEKLVSPLTVERPLTRERRWTLKIFTFINRSEKTDYQRDSCSKEVLNVNVYPVKLFITLFVYKNFKTRIKVLHCVVMSTKCFGC